VALRPIESLNAAQEIHVKNFRLLHDAALLLEKKTTVIVAETTAARHL